MTDDFDFDFDVERGRTEPRPTSLPRTALDKGYGAHASNGYGRRRQRRGRRRIATSAPVHKEPQTRPTTPEGPANGKRQR